MSHAGTAGSAITQLAFSPTENLIAWTDTDGVLTRWLHPIPDEYPDPIKSSIASAGSATVPVKRKSSPGLFGNDPFNVGVGVGSRDDVGDMDLDIGMGDIDDDWIIDDIGGGLQDEPEVGKRSGDGFVKEMGTTFIILACHDVEKFSG